MRNKPQFPDNEKTAYPIFFHLPTFFQQPNTNQNPLKKPSLVAEKIKEKWNPGNPKLINNSLIHRKIKNIFRFSFYPPKISSKKTTKKNGERKRKGNTLLDSLDLGAHATGGVDGFLVLLGGGVERLLPDHHRFPVLRQRSDSCHRYPFVVLPWNCCSLGLG